MVWFFRPLVICAVEKRWFGSVSLARTVICWVAAKPLGPNTLVRLRVAIK